MNQLVKLQELLAEFPGIGPRQAKRFAYFLIRKDQIYINEFLEALKSAKDHVKLCTESFQYFYAHNLNETLSPIARDKNRDNSLLMIVERDADLEAIEKSNTYNGKYFVLGGTIPILEKEPEKRIRSRNLLKIVNQKITTAELKEIILALNVTPESDNTSVYIGSLLKEVAQKNSVKLSHLGRGLSTGTELEYADSETIRNALTHRE